MQHPVIPKSALQFLKNLSKNNDRDWFAKNKSKYETAHAALKIFKDAVGKEMGKYDNIEKVKLHRIYRDVRFSKNKLPYKKSFSGSLSRATNQLRGGYYWHIEPGGNSIVGGGFWGPNSEDLKRIRQHIAFDDQPLRKILKSAKFKKQFGTLQGEQLKTAPRGFEKDHPAVDLLRYKQLYAFRTFTDAEVLDEKFLAELVKTFLALRPYFDYMSEILTTDLNGVPLYD
ncbi:MAG: DUF2461 domain-containing protein [Saprospiraceae bacterium]